MAKPTLDHIGIAVESLAEGVKFYEALGLELEGVEEVSKQGVKVGFLPVGDPRIELLEPTGPSSRHPMWRYCRLSLLSGSG